MAGNNPTPAGGSQTLFPRAASSVSFPSETNCIGRQKSREKGVPVAGSVPYFPQRRHQSRALGRGTALNSGRAAPKPQGTGTGTPTWDGLSAACPTPNSQQQQPERLFPNTEQGHEDRQNLLPYVVKKSSSISCSSPQAFFIWGVRVSGFWYLHSSFSGTSYRCGLNENMFGFRRDPSCGMGRKNLSIIFSKVRQLPLPSGGGFGG